jgi:hypothetical protein
MLLLLPLPSPLRLQTLLPLPVLLQHRRLVINLWQHHQQSACMVG